MKGKAYTEKRVAISLGHEMIHALRDTEEGQLYYSNGEVTTYSGIRPNGKNNSINKEEFMTVGLIEWDGGNSDRITENDLRRQLGMPVRRWY